MIGSAVLSLISQDRARLQRWCKVSSSLLSLLTVTSLHVCGGSHSECPEAAPGILPNPDHQSVPFMCAYELSLRSPSRPQKSSLRRKSGRPVGPPSLLGPTFAYLIAFLDTEPSPSKSIQVTRCRIIPQPLRHAALLRLILLSGFTLPGAAKNSVCNTTSNLQ